MPWRIWRIEQIESTQTTLSFKRSENFNNNSSKNKIENIYLILLQQIKNFIASEFWTSIRDFLKVKSRFFKNHELYWSNLPKNSNCGQELQKSGVQILVGEGQIFLSRFLFIFIFSMKNWILIFEVLFFIFVYELNINKGTLNKFHFMYVT